MTTSRYFFALFIISAGILGSFFITRDSIERSPSVRSSSTPVSATISASLPVISWTRPSSSLVVASSSNMTLTLGSDLLKQAWQVDFTSPSSASLSPTRISSALDESLRNSSAIDLPTSVPLSSLLVSNDTSREAKTRYIQGITDVSTKYLPNVDYGEVLTDVYRRLDGDSALRVAEAYTRVARAYRDVAVPRDLVALHTSLILHFEQGAVIYRALADYPTDPLKGYIALPLVDDLLKSAANVNNQLYDAITKL